MCISVDSNKKIKLNFLFQSNNVENTLYKQLNNKCICDDYVRYSVFNTLQKQTREREREGERE